MILPRSVPVYVFGWNDLRFARRAERSSSADSDSFGADGGDRDETDGKAGSDSESPNFCSRRAASANCARIAATSALSSVSDF